jgi:hypothetical protein
MTLPVDNNHKLENLARVTGKLVLSVIGIISGILLFLYASGTIGASSSSTSTAAPTTSAANQEAAAANKVVTQADLYLAIAKAKL